MQEDPILSGNSSKILNFRHLNIPRHICNITHIHTYRERERERETKGGGYVTYIYISRERKEGGNGTYRGLCHIYIYDILREKREGGYITYMYRYIYLYIYM